MPKVTDEYIASKKEFILQCVNEVCAEKPIYEITMRDIIKKTGYSQGAIYRYYANLDELFLELINRNTTNFPLEQRIDELLCAGLEVFETFSKCMMTIGTYIQEFLKLSTSKMYFELLATYAYDTQRQDCILPQLKFKKSYEYAKQRTAEYITEQIKCGAFTSIIAIESLLPFFGAAMDGISNDAVFSAVGVNGEKPSHMVDVLDMFEVLSKSILGFLTQSQNCLPIDEHQEKEMDYSVSRRGIL